MIISNKDYASIVERARASGASNVDFNNIVEPISSIKVEQDTVTLSQQAKALMNGDNNEASQEEIAPTYVRPQTASSLLAQNDTSTTDVRGSEKATRFEQMMQNILDQRTGIDREKLEEINAMIEEIANDESLTPEEKTKIIEQLEEMKEELTKEMAELQKVLEQTNTNKNKEEV